MLSVADIGVFVGAFIATFLVSRLLLWLLRGWQGGHGKVFTVHFISLVIISLLAGMGMADGGAFVPLQAAAVYLLPQFIWLMVDQFRYNQTEKALAAEARPLHNVSYPTESTPLSPKVSIESRIEALERLSALRANGALTADEYEVEKRRVLDS